MHAKASLLLLVTGVAEVTVGIGLLLTPGVVLDVLLGVEQARTETLFVGRITGAAILGIGLVCWLMRNDTSQVSLRSLIIGIAVYTIAAAVLLVFADLSSNMVGIMLWPGIIFHTVLAVWCFVWLASSSPTEPMQSRRHQG